MIVPSLLRPAGAVFLVAGAALAISSAPPKSQPNTFVAVLTAGQLTPMPASNATGVGFGTLEPDGMFCFSLSYDLLSAENAAHIHGPALPGANAGVRWELEIAAPKKACLGPLTRKEKRRLRGGLYYFVVHSEEFLRGELRGQIVPVVAPAS